MKEALYGPAKAIRMHNSRRFFRDKSDHGANHHYHRHHMTSLMMTIYDEPSGDNIKAPFLSSTPVKCPRRLRNAK